MEARIKQVMARVLKVSEDEINENSSPDTIKNWDSLIHMQLILALEQEFGIEIDGMQITEMLSYPLIVITIKEVLGKV